MIEVTFRIPDHISTERANELAVLVIRDKRFRNQPYCYQVKPDNGPNRKLTMVYREIDAPVVQTVFDLEGEKIRCELIEAVIERLNELFGTNGTHP